MIDITGDSQHITPATKLSSHLFAPAFDQAIALLSDDIEVELPSKDEDTGLWSRAGNTDKI